MAQSAASWHNTHTHVNRTHSLKTYINTVTNNHVVRSASSAITEFGIAIISNTRCGIGDSVVLAAAIALPGFQNFRDGSIGRASDSRFSDPRFEPRQEHKKKNVVLTRCRCAQTPCVYIRTHKNDHARSLKIL